MYRIAWRSLITGKRGTGDWLRIPLHVIEAEVARLNAKYFRDVFHWVEDDAMC